MWGIIPFLALIFFALEPSLERAKNFLIIDQPIEAVHEAENFYSNHTSSYNAFSMLLKAYAASGQVNQACHLLETRADFKDRFINDRQSLEDLAWGVIKKESKSSQNQIRLSAYIGAYLSQDALAVPVLLNMLRDSNFLIRLIGVKMSAGYPDEPIKIELKRLLLEETNREVRLELLQVVGLLKIKSTLPYLNKLIQSEESTLEEKMLSVKSIAAMTDSLSLSDLKLLSKSSRMGLRLLCCHLCVELGLKEGKEEVLGLLTDANSDVRVAALCALGLFYRFEIEPELLKQLIFSRCDESHPFVSITACWVGILCGLEHAKTTMSKWLNSSNPVYRQLASSATAATGEAGIDFMAEQLKQAKDSLIQVNLALGLIGQRKHIKDSADIIAGFLTKENDPLSIDASTHPIFDIVRTSATYQDSFVNLRDALDQKTRLYLASVLSSINDIRALEILRDLLSKKRWQFIGPVAAFTLQDGDDGCIELVRNLMDDSDPQIRLQACLVLAILGKEKEVITRLYSSFEDADFETKVAILEGIGSLGDVSAVTFLVDKLKEPFPILKIAAASAIIRSLYR
jgi:HEAT repeat protein